MAGLAVTYGLNLNARLSRWILSFCKLENKIISIERIYQYSKIPSEAPPVIESSRPPSSWPENGTIELVDLKVSSCFSPHHAVPSFSLQHSRLIYAILFLHWIFPSSSNFMKKVCREWVLYGMRMENLVAFQYFLWLKTEYRFYHLSSLSSPCLMKSYVIGKFGLCLWFFYLSYHKKKSGRKIM